MTRSIPPHRTLSNSPLFTLGGQKQKVMLGTDKELAEFAVWVEIDGPQGPGRRPLLFSSDPEAVVARFNDFVAELQSKGYQSAEEPVTLTSEMVFYSVS